MSRHLLKKISLYQQLESLPNGLLGEIIHGQLYTQPRPGWPHAFAASSLGGELVGPYQKGRGGPGGWWIIDEPEVHFVLDQEVLVPDIAGWRQIRMPNPPHGHKVEVIPDWVCEIFSPSTKSKDREEKMPIYAHYGMSYAWLVDPKAHCLEAFELKQGEWVLLGKYEKNAKVCVAPFDNITINLDELWSS